MTVEHELLKEAREQEFSDESHPNIALLSNGRYSVMITAGGADGRKLSERLDLGHHASVPVHHRGVRRAGFAAAGCRTAISHTLRPSVCLRVPKKNEASMCATSVLPVKQRPNQRDEAVSR